MPIVETANWDKNKLMQNERTDAWRPWILYRFMITGKLHNISKPWFTLTRYHPSSCPHRTASVLCYSLRRFTPVFPESRQTYWLLPWFQSPSCWSHHHLARTLRKTATTFSHFSRSNNPRGMLAQMDSHRSALDEWWFTCQNTWDLFWAIGITNKMLTRIIRENTHFWILQILWFQWWRFL